MHLFSPSPTADGGIDLPAFPGSDRGYHSDAKRALLWALLEPRSPPSRTSTLRRVAVVASIATLAVDFDGGRDMCEYYNQR